MRNPELLESRNGLSGRWAPTTMTWRVELRIEHCLATKVRTPYTDDPDVVTLHARWW